MSSHADYAAATEMEFVSVRVRVSRSLLVLLSSCFVRAGECEYECIENAGCIPCCVVLHAAVGAKKKPFPLISVPFNAKRLASSFKGTS